MYVPLYLLWNKPTCYLNTMPFVFIVWHKPYLAWVSFWLHMSTFDTEFDVKFSMGPLVTKRIDIEYSNMSSKITNWHWTPLILFLIAISLQTSPEQEDNLTSIETQKYQICRHCHRCQFRRNLICFIISENGPNNATTGDNWNFRGCVLEILKVAVIHKTEWKESQ